MSGSRAISDAGRAYLQLHLASDVGSILACRLIEHFGTPGRVLSASSSALLAVDQVGPRTAAAIVAARDEERAALQEARAEALGIRILCLADGDYPRPLRMMADPPICLYVRGRMEPADCVAVAVVGTRRCSQYGREQALRFGHSLGSAGFTVVSGLARGVDGFAHRGSIQGGGRTLAVLGCGLDRVYPPEHAALASAIASGHGAIISEYPLDSVPAPGDFPRRNRLIAGLSLGVVVVEAGPRGGACITARLAHDYNREVFAVPGRVDFPVQTAGVNGLIRDGQAKLVTCLEDILEELGDVGLIMGDAAAAGGIRPAGDGATEGAVELLDTAFAGMVSEREARVLRCLAGGTQDVESIASAVDISIGEVAAVLTALQVKGRVRRLPGNRFAAGEERSDGA